MKTNWKEEFLNLRNRGKLETGDVLIDFISRIEQEAREDERNKIKDTIQIFTDWSIRTFNGTKTEDTGIFLSKFLDDLLNKI
jgi:hypothetical protein